MSLYFPYDGFAGAALDEAGGKRSLNSTKRNLYSAAQTISTVGPAEWDQSFARKTGEIARNVVES